MAEGGADLETGETTDGTGGADQNPTGATTDGESGAGSDKTGATGGADLADKFQEIRNRAEREVRKALEPKLQELRSEKKQLEAKLEELTSEEGEGDDDALDLEDRDDVYTESQVSEMKRSYQSKIEEREEELEKLRERVEVTNRATARNRLIEALRERNVIKPDVFAETLIAQGRLEADIAEDDGFTVYTPDGNKMLNGEGEDATPEDLAESWVADNPEFVESSQRKGAGYSDTGGSAAKGSKPASEMSDEEKRAFINEHGRQAWEDKVYEDYAA